MYFARVLAGCAVLGAVLVLSTNGNLSQGQDKKEPPKVKGQLPPNWSKLELTAAQKDEIYKIQADYKQKTDKLAEEIRKLNAELAQKRAAVLTDDQKKKLAELVGVDPKPKEKSKENPKN
jgi:cytochrome c556